MTLDFLTEKGIDEKTAKDILACFSERMAEKEEEHKDLFSRAQTMWAQKEDELGKEVAMLKREMRERKIDGMLQDSGLRSSLVREAARRALLALDGGEEEYLASLRESEPELFEDIAYPKFVRAQGEDEMNSAYCGLRFVKGGGE